MPAVGILPTNSDACTVPWYLACVYRDRLYADFFFCINRVLFLSLTSLWFSHVFACRGLCLCLLNKNNIKGVGLFGRRDPSAGCQERSRNSLPSPREAPEEKRGSQASHFRRQQGTIESLSLASCNCFVLPAVVGVHTSYHVFMYCRPKVRNRRPSLFCGDPSLPEKRRKKIEYNRVPCLNPGNGDRTVA